jgi:hypothetical protein
VIYLDSSVALARLRLARGLEWRKQIALFGGLDRQ